MKQSEHTIIITYTYYCTVHVRDVHAQRMRRCAYGVQGGERSVRGARACHVAVELRTGGISRHILTLSSQCLARNWEGRRRGADRFDDHRTSGLSGGWVGCKPYVNSVLQATAAAVIWDRLPSGRWMRPSLTMAWPALTQRMRMHILQPGSPGPPDSGTPGAWSAAAQVQSTTSFSFVKDSRHFG